MTRGESQAVWRVLFAVVIVANTMLSLSAGISTWWDDTSPKASSRLPEAAGPLVRARGGASNADVHVLLWFVAALVLWMVVRHIPWPRKALPFVALWIYTGVLELAQRWVSTRTPQLIDMVGNGLGIAAAIVAAAVTTALWPMARQPATS